MTSCSWHRYLECKINMEEMPLPLEERYPEEKDVEWVRFFVSWSHKLREEAFVPFLLHVFCLGCTSGPSQKYFQVYLAGGLKPKLMNILDALPWNLLVLIQKYTDQWIQWHSACRNTVEGKHEQKWAFIEGDKLPRFFSVPILEMLQKSGLNKVRSAWVEKTARLEWASLTNLIISNQHFCKFKGCESP